MKFNADLANLAYQNILDNAPRFQIVLFEGGLVSPTELNNNFNSGATSPVLNNLPGVISLCNGRGGKVVAVAEVTRSLFPAMNTAPAMNVNLQFKQVPLTVVNAGSPTWYLMMVRNAAVGYNAAGLSWFNFTGSVSIYGGGGDMEVEDLFTSLNTSKRVVNIRFRQRLPL